MKLGQADRDLYLRREWSHIALHLPHLDEPIAVVTGKASMWEGHCRELIHKEIGVWLKKAELFPWLKGKPPKIRLQHLGDTEFQVIP